VEAELNSVDRAAKLDAMSVILPLLEDLRLLRDPGAVPSTRVD
jgi:hypothetical protein